MSNRLFPVVFGFVMIFTSSSALNTLQRLHLSHVSHDRVNASSHADDPLPGLSWKDLKHINGMRSSDLAFLLISSWVDKQGGNYYRRILPGMHTWMRLVPSSNVFILVEDNEVTRHALQECPSTTDALFTSYTCPKEPTFILSRTCDNSGHNQGDYRGLCCKIDDLVSFLVHSRPATFHKIKYSFIADEDYFFRVDRVLAWLGHIDKSNHTHLPLIANDMGTVGYPMYCRIQRGSRCSEINPYGWYGAAMLNKAALKIYGAVSREYPLMQMCVAWGCAQDIGFGLLAWMFGYNHLAIPGGITQTRLEGHDGKDLPGELPLHEHYLKNGGFVYHHVYLMHEESFRCHEAQPTTHIALDAPTLLGCGSPGRAAPANFKGLNSYQVWNYFAENGTDELDMSPRFWRWSAEGEPVPIVRPLLGYNLTKHWRMHRDGANFSTFTLDSCENIPVELYEL